MEIERDLIRWSRVRWGLIVAAVLGAQGLLFLANRQRPTPLPTPNTKEPALSFVGDSTVIAEPLALEDPTLFASANPRGFSGAAWMIRNGSANNEAEALPAPAFLSLQEARGLREDGPRAQFTLVRHERPEPEPAATDAAPKERFWDRSELKADGPRELRSAPTLPVQFARDVVRSSVVEVLIDADGTVFSARLQGSSGSKSADNDALSLARKVRFQPTLDGQTGDRISLQELIFDWKALPPGATNPVKR